MREIALNPPDWARRLIDLGSLPSDTEELRLRKSVLVLSSSLMAAERLLLNILPASIASRLKESDQVIAEGFGAATVLFADIVGFTPLAQPSRWRTPSPSSKEGGLDRAPGLASPQRELFEELPAI